MPATLIINYEKCFKLISSFPLKSLVTKRLVKSVKVVPAGIKLINPIQKHPHVIQSCACILKIFVVIDKEPSINF